MLSDKGPAIIDIVPSGRLHQDGHTIIADNDEGLRLRKKMAYAGHVSVSLVVNSKGRLISGPEVRISGFPEGREGKILEDMIDSVADEAEDVFEDMSPKARKDEDLIEDRLRSKVKRFVKNYTGKRTHVEVTAHKVK